jgi:phosphoglycerate dehydrogenase-like enzyme
MEHLMAQADVISLHLPYSKERHHLLNERLLGLMRPDAILVNCAPSTGF